MILPELSLTNPAGQLVQSDMVEDPLESRYFPALHVLQVSDDCFTRSLYLPASHSVQPPALDNPKVPLNLPVGQS